jgi:molybdate transport system substrate-binding protein
MSDSITVISSMATKELLAELARAFEAHSGRGVRLESVGGTDVARRVRAGEAFDVVVLGRETIEALLAAGHLLAGSRVDLAHSDVAVAVRAGEPRPDIGNEGALKQAVLAARTIGYSTGPSGVELVRLFERWSISDVVRERVVTPPPGVPVGSLVARGEVELGFQQLSELMHLEGIDVIGPLPAEIRIVTTFTAGIGTASIQADSANLLISFMASPGAADAMLRHGMRPAAHRRREPEASIA